jgi:CSLREA domain-containing protein
MISTKTQREAKGRASALGLLLAVLMAACVLLTANPAHAATFTVNSTRDAGDQSPGNGLCFTGGFIQVGPRFARECTLRAAIEETNTNDNNATVVDAINFGIPGAGPHTISPASSLPKITEPVTIDGYTQPGASENTLAVGNNAVLLIRLDGSDAGLAVGLHIRANDSVVRGLSITRFSFSGAGLSRADNNRIEGNFLGTDPGGTQVGLGNGFGLFLEDDGGSIILSDNNTVGGTSPEARNIISGNGDAGVFFFSSGGNNKVLGNYIGTTKSGTGELGNASSGVLVLGRNNTTIGGSARNTVAFNGRHGVEVDHFATGNRILRNSIFSNVGLGIELGEDGRTANDPGDADTGANKLQNFPVLSSAETVGATTIKGGLNSTPG